MADVQLMLTPRSEGPDLEERDYYGLNTVLSVDFEDIIAEPDTIHTYGCVWKNAYKCFNVCFVLWYTLNTLCCGFVSVLFVASEMATSFFLYVWCATPCLRAMHFRCMLPRHCCQACVQCAVTPCCEPARKHWSIHSDS